MEILKRLQPGLWRFITANGRQYQIEKVPGYERSGHWNISRVVNGVVQQVYDADETLSGAKQLARSDSINGV